MVDCFQVGCFHHKATFTLVPSLMMHYTWNSSLKQTSGETMGNSSIGTKEYLKHYNDSCWYVSKSNSLFDCSC